jgi:hypothetical protein
LPKRFSDAKDSHFIEMLRVGANNLCDEQLWKDLCAEAAVRLLRATEPVSVDLGKCARAAESIILHRLGRNIIDGYTLEMSKEQAKAVLDAAGVKYHED